MACEPREIGGPLPEQQQASQHRAGHARLLAGPGTGKTKTLVDLIAGLVNDGVPSNAILALTFTRAAAAGLRAKVRKALADDQEPPAVFTLHGFALRQLMKQQADIGSGKGHVRVADDWEERWIVIEDLKGLLKTDVKDVRRRLAALSAAWETDPSPGVEARHPDTELLGALRLHKDRYRYVLRSELVYQLKVRLDADPDFDPGTYQWAVVDEYQDLNLCDVGVIDAIAERGASLFVAGDDDQSIYQQLRNAHPQAIRDFVTTHDAADLRLTICVRCDASVVNVAQALITQEVGRQSKDLRPHEDSGPGSVVSLGFADEREEAKGVAKISRALIDAGLNEHEVLVLLRSDRNGAFSSVIDEEMRALRVPAIVRTKDATPLGTASGRLLLGYLRLLTDATDDLAWRSILEMPGNGVGDTAISALHELASQRNEAFAQTLAAVAADPTLLPRFGSAVAAAVNTATANLDQIHEDEPATPPAAVDAIVDLFTTTEELELAKAELLVLASAYDAGSLSEFLAAIALRKEEEEAIVPRTVNILTAHKAKGLDACVVIIPAADEELVPGGNNVDEERRLFYVSLTRARHLLIVAHAAIRRGQQAMSGTPIGGRNHRRTTFMDASGVRAVPGRAFAATFAPDPRLLTPPSKGGRE